MKRLVFAFITLTTFSAHAQTIDASKIPDAVKSSFEKEYPGISGKWEKEDANYEVNFTQNNNAMSMTIESNGNVIETEMDINTSGLPAQALTYIKEHYKGKKISEAAKITKTGGIVNYEAEVGNADIIFDSNGKFLKEVKEEKDEKNKKD